MSGTAAIQWCWLTADSCKEEAGRPEVKLVEILVFNDFFLTL